VVAAALSTATIIPGLPDYLRAVPPAPDGPTDPLAAQKRREWHDWAFDLRKYRVQRAQELKDDPSKIPFEVRKCALSPSYFMAMWAWLYEPRQDTRFGIAAGTKPWLPFAIQVELIDWIEERMAAEGSDRDGVVSKSRDMGASWVFCCWALHGWLFKYPWNVLFLSRVQDLVDSKNSDSLFWKIEFIMRHLPDWLLPEGFSLKNRTLNSELSLINPATLTEITGESTTSNSGRGGRYTAVVVDEAAKVPALNDVVSGVSATTFHTFLVSSESNELHTDFYSIGIGNKNTYRPGLFAMDWWEHPLHTPEYMEEEKQRFEARGKIEDYYREYLRDPRAGGSSYVYPVAATLDIDPNVRYDEMGILYASIDPGYNDETAIVWIQQQGPHYNVIASYQNRGREAEFYGSIITGKPAIDPETGLEKFDYSERDRRLMAWTAKLNPGYLKNGNFFGDMNGKSVFGATQDSFYGVLRKLYAIRVNADRNDLGQLVSERSKARQIGPRIEFTRQMLPKFRFSSDYNAPFVLQCLTEAKFAPESGRATSEPKAPIHDDTSHMRTAVEYFCAHLALRSSLESVGKVLARQRAYQNSRDLSPNNPDRRDFGRRRLIGAAD
jgi:hypothetical protein